MQKPRYSSRSVILGGVALPESPGEIPMSKSSGFALIELLIAAGMVVVLAAICVSDFRRAQMWSRISQERGNLRIVATALEAYEADNGSYPLMTYAPFNPPSGVWAANEQFKFYPGYPGQGKAGGLTTPVAYLPGISPLVDVFRLTHTFSSPLPYQIYYLPAAAYRPPYPINSNDDVYRDWLNRYGLWRIASAGPDKWFQNLPGHDGDYAAGGWNRASYDPTNGIASAGDIYRSQKNPDAGLE